MNIIETNLSFSPLSSRTHTNRIILHHAAAKSCDAATIHDWHKNGNGWAGIGYHFVVRKNGTIERGRPENAIGAHASDNNSDSIGICFEGDFMLESMSQEQIDAGRELLTYLKKKYGINKVQKHKDVGATTCPGTHFPFDAIVNGSAADTGKPSTPAGTYVVQKGDTLSAIAKKHGTTVQALAGASGITNPNMIHPGQIIILPGGAEKPQHPQTAKPGNQIIKDGQVHARNFAVPGLKSDGIPGPETNKAKIKVLQQAMNLDYRAGLSVDGIWGSRSEAALKGHTVRRGETQYMVTALEILLMLNGYNPNGLENPGTFGSRLEAAVRQFQKDHGLSVDGIAGYNTFKALIK